MSQQFGFIGVFDQVFCITSGNEEGIKNSTSVQVSSVKYSYTSVYVKISSVLETMIQTSTLTFDYFRLNSILNRR